MRATRSLFSAALIFFIDLYRNLLSHQLMHSCRFLPTCSQYAREALDYYGAMRGVYLAAKRLLRCQPFTPGGFDPLNYTMESG